MTVNCSTLTDPTLCQTMESTGAGLGVFFEYLTDSLPAFLILLGVIAGVVAIVYAIAHVIQNAVKGGMHRR